MSAKKFNTPFAILGDKVEVPTTAQIDGSVSFQQGYPMGYELDYTDPNTKDISRSKTNQLLFDITNAIREIQQGGVSEWSEEGKPYKINSLVYAPDGTIKQSLIANNNNATTHSSWSTLVNASALATLDAQNVKLTGNQTISGTKTFSSNPLSTATQSPAVNALTRKDYVDGLDAQNVKKSANLSDLANKSTARTNLGLGTAATRDVGESSGNVMEVGAFGIGSINHVKYPADSLNTVVPSGFYFARADKGFPIFPDGHVLVVSFSNAFAVQIAYDYRSSKTMRRSVNNGVWTEWDEFLSTRNILTTTGQSTQFPMTQKAVTDELNTKVGLSGNQTISGVKTFSSSPIVPTPTAGDNSTKVATTAFVKAKSEADSIGVNQTWQNMTASRTSGVTYTNATGKPIAISAGGNGHAIKIVVGGVEIKALKSGEDYVFAIVPIGNTYSITCDNILIWAELR